MIFPLRLVLSLAGYIGTNALRGVTQYPLVLMLEPTFSCNLTCVGCGKVREGRAVGNRMLSVEECLGAVDEAGSPVVAIAGGEPLLHPEIGQIVEQIVARRRFIHLCTNGIALEGSLGKFKPSPFLSIVFHIDGLAATHDRIVERAGVFELAVAGIKAAKSAGFRVGTNTTVFRGTGTDELRRLFTLLTELGVDGMMIAPAFTYENVDAGVFLSREDVPAVLAPLLEKGNAFRFYHSPAYLDFLAGRKSLRCTPWSTPTRNSRGWKSPCYLLNDGYYPSLRQMLQDTPWDRYGYGNDPRCANCMLHSGFEASAIGEISRNLPTIPRFGQSSPRAGGQASGETR